MFKVQSNYAFSGIVSESESQIIAEGPLFREGVASMEGGSFQPSFHHFNLFDILLIIFSLSPKAGP